MAFKLCQPYFRQSTECVAQMVAQLEHSLLRSVMRLLKHSLLRQQEQDFFVPLELELQFLLLYQLLLPLSFTLSPIVQHSILLFEAPIVF
ncbi:hypothetical protein HZ326_22719 [Fusarium oxysporum f. sp. albedinis]|nr:hypothetical protein HZ326_22719 [Fusarium oxysporum f. sp. albedinis]